jgi:hypothetical protein
MKKIPSQPTRSNKSNKKTSTFSDDEIKTISFIKDGEIIQNMLIELAII